MGHRVCCPDGKWLAVLQREMTFAYNQVGGLAINACLSVYTETVDIDGVRRPPRPSLGAYEYRPPP